MAFKEIADLETEKTIALGGLNKKTGKPNPKQIEGFYLGSKEVTSKLSKTGLAWLHVFQTDTGKTGVWGKTNLDFKMKQAVPGTMTRVTQTGTKPSDKGNPMYLYSVLQDKDNVLEDFTPITQDSGGGEEGEAEGYDSGAGYDEVEAEEEQPVDETEYKAPVRAARPATTSSPAQQKRIQDALRSKRPA